MTVRPDRTASWADLPGPPPEPVPEPPRAATAPRSKTGRQESKTGRQDAAIVLEDVRRSFGKQAVVDGLTFHVKHGSILGLIGPSGAGKTTTIRMLTGAVHRPAAGSAFSARTPSASAERSASASATCRSCSACGATSAPRTTWTSSPACSACSTRAAGGRRGGSSSWSSCGMPAARARPTCRRHAAAARARLDARPRPCGRLPRRADGWRRPAPARNDLGRASAPQGRRRDAARHDPSTSTRPRSATLLP